MDDRAVAANAAMTGTLGMNPQTLERITEIDLCTSLKMTKRFKTA